MNSYIECPSCGQGAVEKMRIMATGELIQLCDECEATWLGDVEPLAPGFDDFGLFMERRGLRPDWSELRASE
ncbi:hypothetical protein PZ938_02045 [Luteipulveratus sp. YIM 133132]|uniref:hypothetical protein n=1 Tax=Luteipulveratus flavus TaxID=3031728 RepID=UPI0023B0D9B3|nr:hypothetical protein [Luteipulveratus sp. YIM 133132]MDE9364375.1 hypothetical protein [Luteipulveratus sp. YIM 133132]